MSKKSKKTHTKKPAIAKSIPAVEKPVQAQKQALAKHELPIKLIKKDLAKTMLFALFSIGIIFVLKQLKLSF